jgi:fucose permease
MIILNIIPLFHFIIIGAVCILGVFLHKNKLNSDEHIVPESRPFLVKPDRYLWLLGLIAFCVMVGENTAFDWSINYFEQVVKADKAFLTLGYTCFIIAMSSGRLLGDRLIHRFGHTNMLLGNGVLMSSGYILTALIPTTVSAAFGFFLVGLGDSIVVPIVYSLASRSNKMPANYAIASVTLIGYTGFLVAPLIIGSVSQAFGMQWAFLFVGLLALCISLLTIKVKKMM